MRGCAPRLVVCACAFRFFVSISFDTVHYPWSRRAHFEGARRQELCHPYADSAEGDSVAARRTRSVRHCADGHWQDRGLCVARSEEHTSELQSLMRISYAAFCLKKKIIYVSHTNLTAHYTTHDILANFLKHNTNDKHPNT